MASASEKYSITCLCGAAHQDVDGIVSSSGQDGPDVIKLCHCDDCRHSTGLLCASYVRIAEPSSLTGLAAHISGVAGGEKITRYFCRTCGCHVFRCTEKDGDKGTWEVATGVIAAAEGDRGGQSSGLPKTEHVHVEDTKDGGLAPWLGAGDHMKSDPNPSEISTPAAGDDVLPAECHCGNVKFHLTRPNEASTHPRSQFPDLMIAYHEGSPITPNPDNVKWWLRAGSTKYLAGTCTCRSCRLISGFEVQTWTFVPRPNILFHVSSGHADAEGTVPLDFGTLPRGILQGYESSPGVLREFCPVCGATVFWHDKWRPDVIDVSVGLLRAESGARAEGWLDWWKGRVSFVEDAELDRKGWPARWAVDLAQGLEEGLKKEDKKE